MKAFKFIFVVIILSVNFTQHIAAQDESGQRRERLKAFWEKRRTQKELQSASNQIVTKFNIPYSGESDPLKQLDIYCPKKGEKFPVLIHFHGGGWKMGDKCQTKEHGIFYATHGILFISVNYRLSPAVQHPAHIEDCATAVAWVFKNLQDLKGDPNRVFISGHSAGAHLAALLSTDQKYLQKYSLSPKMLAGVIPVDTASFDLLSASNEKIVKNFIIEAFGTNPEILKSASPFYNVSAKETYPKFLIFNTSNRESAAAESKKFVDRLKNTGGDVQFIVVDNHTHRDMNLAMYNASDPVGSTILKFILYETNE